MAAVLLLPAISVAVATGTLTVIGRSVLGVTVKL